MKKCFIAAAALAFCLAACGKKYKENVVRYKLNGVQREVTGKYQQITLCGLSNNENALKFGFSAYSCDYNEQLGVGGGTSMNPVHTIVVFDSSVNNATTHRMFIRVNTLNGSQKSFSSVKNQSGGFIIDVNDAKKVSGTFSGRLYYLGYFGDEPPSDSVEITDGYFYFNKP